MTQQLKMPSVWRSIQMAASHCWRERKHYGWKWPFLIASTRRNIIHVYRTLPTAQAIKECVEMNASAIMSKAFGVGGEVEVRIVDKLF